jgi:hypothetical protein
LSSEMLLRLKDFKEENVLNKFGRTWKKVLLFLVDWDGIVWDLMIIDWMYLFMLNLIIKLNI